MCVIFNIYLCLKRYNFVFNAIYLHYNLNDIRVWNQELKNY